MSNSKSKHVWRLYAQSFVFSGVIRVLVEIILGALLVVSVFSILFRYLSPDFLLPFFFTPVLLFSWLAMSLVWRFGYLWLHDAIWHAYVIIAVKKSLFTAVLIVLLYMAP